MTSEKHLKPVIRQVTPQASLRWLAAGWNDFRRAGMPSLLHGLIVSLVSLGILTMTMLYWEILPGAVTGFVLIGPFLATGLYAMSRQLETNEATSLEAAVKAWQCSSGCVFRFGLLLLLAATAWVGFSIIMFHYFIPVTINNPLDFLIYAVTQTDLQFMLWTILGALGSALAFSVTVVTLPLIVDREIDMKRAILTSIKAVGDNPVTMLWWAMVIMFITGLSFLTGMLGFIVLYPLLGHASWHAYRDVVDASALPLRTQGN
jgi:uncharacterized membrane protein